MRRHLYEEPLRSCYLFTGLKAKFLDALMASCRTDLFLPHVRILPHKCGGVGCVNLKRVVAVLLA